VSDALGDAPIAQYRALRRSIEHAVLPLASSVDGRRFTMQASLHDLAFETGGYVVVGDGESARLGQVISLELAQQAGPEVGVAAGADVDLRSQVVVRAARGEGVILDAGGPFHDMNVRPAGPADVAAALDRAGSRHADLPIGELLLAPGIPAELGA